MMDPYVYPNTNILRNLANSKDAKEVAVMEADYTMSRLSDLAVMESEGLLLYIVIFSKIYMTGLDKLEQLIWKRKNLR